MSEEKKKSLDKRIAEVARKRVREMMTYHDLSTKTLERLMMSAYVQGIKDAAESVG